MVFFSIEVAPKFTEKEFLLSLLQTFFIMVQRSGTEKGTEFSQIVPSAVTVSV